MIWKKLQRAATGSPSDSSISSATKSLYRLSLEKPSLDNNVLIKIHYKDNTYRIRFDLNEGYHMLRKRIMMKLNFPENEATLVSGYIDLYYNLICINNTEDLLVCKQYTESHYNTEYIRIVVYDSDENKRTILRDYKDMEMLRKGDLGVEMRTKPLLSTVSTFPQGRNKELHEPQKSFQLATFTEGVVTTNEINYEFKDGYDGLWKLITEKCEVTDEHRLAYFDRYSSLTVIRDDVELNESYNSIHDNRDIILYFFPKFHFRKAYKHHCQEVEKRRKASQITAVHEKQDSLPPPDYHTLSKSNMDEGVRYFKIRWNSEVPYYSSFNYNPHNGILVFKDNVSKKAYRKLDGILGYFDEDMDSITIESDEDLVECARAIKGPITVTEVLNWQIIRKGHRVWSDDLCNLHQIESNNWGN